MNNQVYSRYLYQMLMEFGSVTVPSLGTFTLQFNESAFRDDKKLLTPPHSSVNFAEKDDASKTFAGLLTESGMSEGKADLLQKLVIEDYNRSKTQNAPFELAGLGKVVNGDFIVNNASCFNKYAGLKEIKIKSVPQPVIHDEGYLYRLNGLKKTEVKPSGISYLLPLLIGFFVLSFMLFMLFGNNNSENKEGDINTALKTEKEVIAADTINDTSSAINTYNEEIASITDEIISNKEPKSEKSSDSNKEVENKVTQDSNGQSCVVIVGAFKDTSNAIKMLNSIAARGYKTYSADHGGLRRVGVEYNCSAISPDEFKLKVRKQFNKNAWHLHDTL